MNARRLVSIAVFTALITVGGLVSVPIPFAQVELSFQTLFVIMACCSADATARLPCLSI